MTSTHSRKVKSMPMKFIIQWGIVMVAMLGLMGCGSEENYAKGLNTWNGASERALFQTWGTPQQTEKLADGNTLYTYRVAERESQPVMYVPNYSRVSTQNQNATLLSQPPVQRNADHQNFWCDTQFEVNPDGMIVKTSFEGNNCVASKSYSRQLSY